MRLNEKGVTLVEILAAMTILSIILLSIVQFFPQIGRLNQHNDVKMKGMNIAKEVLVEWSHSKEVVGYLNGINPPPTGYLSTNDQGFHLFRTKIDGLDVLIKINSNSDLNPGSSAAHYIHIEIQDSTGKHVSETYGYVKVDGVGAE
jgi:prepilin-type N-terminal cleavage/methylation domain-containing protein